MGPPHSPARSHARAAHINGGGRKREVPGSTWQLIPYVDVRWVRDDEGNPAQPLRLVLAAGGDLMRMEGEPRRPLLRVRDEAAPVPRVNLSAPGALSVLAARDPVGYGKVREMLDVVRKYGCGGAALGHIQSLVAIDFVGCGPPETLIGFALGGTRYVVHLPTS
jgi:hypothetical protein